LAKGWKLELKAVSYWLGIELGET